jgi:hypothetical protein
MGLRLYYVSVPDTAIDDLRASPGLSAALLRGWKPSAGAPRPRRRDAALRATAAATPVGRLPLPLDLVSRLPARISDEFIRRGLRFHPAPPADEPARTGDNVTTLLATGELPPWMRPDAVRGSLGLAWHAIHDILVRSPEPDPGPRAFLMHGGVPVGGGRRPARFFTGAQVREICAALRPIDAQTFEARFDPAALAAHRIHPPIWDRDPDELREFYAAHYQRLCRDLATIVSAGEGLLLGRL